MLRIRVQGRRYARVYSWLIGESIRATPKAWWGMVLATAATLGANASVVGVILGYVWLVENNVPLSIFGMATYPRESFLLLALAVAALISASLVLAISEYFAGANSIRGMVGLQKHCTLRAIELYRHLPDPRALPAGEILKEKPISYLAGGDANQCGLAIFFIGPGIQSLFMLLAAVGVMAFLDPKTTMVVCGLGLIVVAAQYPSNLSAATWATQYTRTRAEVQEGIRSLLDRLSAHPRHYDNEDLSTELRQYFNDPVPRLHFQAAEGRFRAKEISGLTMRFGSALILGGVIMVFGISVLRQQVEWSTLLAYLTLLRIALGSATSVFQTVTSVTRLYPDIQVFSDYVRSASQAEAPLEGKQSGALIFSLRTMTVDGVEQELQLQPGFRCALMAPESYGREVAISLQLAVQTRDASAGTQSPASVDIAMMRPGKGRAKAASGWRDEEAPALSRLSEKGDNIVLVDRRAVSAIGGRAGRTGAKY